MTSEEIRQAARVSGLSAARYGMESGLFEDLLFDFVKIVQEAERRAVCAKAAGPEDQAIYNSIAANYRNGSVKGAYSAEETRELLRQKASELGSQKALAATCGVSDQFLSDIILGKREPSGKPLEYLGLRRAVRYEPNA